MSKIDRRTFMRHAAVAGATTAAFGAVTLATSQSATAASELAEIAELERGLIDARAVHLAAIRHTDTFSVREGSPEKKAAWKAQSVVCEAECDAEGRLIAYPVRTLDGLLAKGRAMHRAVDWDCLQEEAGPALAADIVRVTGGSNV